MKHDRFNILEYKRTPIPPARIRDYGLWLFGNRCDTLEDMQNPTPCKNPFTAVRYRRFYFCSIAHLTAGKGQVWLEDGTEQKMYPGDCIIVTEGTLNRYGGTDGETFVEDTVNFAGPVADMMQKAGVLRSGIFPIGQVRKIKFIHDLLMEGTIDSHLAAAAKLQQLLMDIYISSSNENSVGKHPVDSLIQEITNAPEKWWSIRELAEDCGISETHLRRLFLEKTGYAPKEYIDNRKMQMAGEMLQSSDKNIAEIARLFGFVDPFHFSRRFKEIMGVSPKFYRKQSH